MPKSAFLETAILNLILNGVGISNLADNTATNPLTSMYFALHTDSPTASGNQTTNEVVYSAYSRVPVLRNSTNPFWTISDFNPANAFPNTTIIFPIFLTGLNNTATYFSLGALPSGAGVIYYYGLVNPSIILEPGVSPQFSTASLISEL
jgi:hypothetical protein